MGKYYSVIFHNNEINSLIDSRTKRQIFGDFKKSVEGTITIKELYNSQLGLCHICKKLLTLNSFDIDHIIPLSLINKERQSDLITSKDNLRIACVNCNRSKKDKLNGVYSIFFKSNPNDKWYGVSKDIYKSFKEINKALYEDKYRLYESALDKDNSSIWKRLFETNIQSRKNKSAKKKEGKTRTLKLINRQLINSWDKEVSRYYSYNNKLPSLKEIIEERLILDIDIEELLPFVEDIYTQFDNVINNKTYINKLIYMETIEVTINAINLYGEIERSDLSLSISMKKEQLTRIISGLKSSLGSSIISKYDLDSYSAEVLCDLKKADLITTVTPILFLETIVKLLKAI